MPRLKQEHCVTDTTILLYDIAVTLERILAVMTPEIPAVETVELPAPAQKPTTPAAAPKGTARRGGEPTTKTNK